VQNRDDVIKATSRKLNTEYYYYFIIIIKTIIFRAALLRKHTLQGHLTDDSLNTKQSRVDADATQE